MLASIGPVSSQHKLPGGLGIHSSGAELGIYSVNLDHMENPEQCKIPEIWEAHNGCWQNNLIIKSLEFPVLFLYFAEQQKHKTGKIIRPITCFKLPF